MANLTKKFIDRLTSDPTKDYCMWDDEIAGFGVRLNPGGTKTYIFQYRNKLRKERRFKIGVHGRITTKQAREQARILFNKVAMGEDPSEIKKTQEIQKKIYYIADLAEEYFTLHAIPNKKERNAKEDRALYTGYILPNFGFFDVQTITFRDIEIWRLTMQHKRIRANRVLALLSTMFSLAVKWGWCDRNPVIGVTRYPENKRDRWLRDEELDRLWQALEPYGDYLPSNIIKMLILTGSRLGEVLNATWEQFDLEHSLWTKPFTHTKQKKTEYVPLSPPTLELLLSMKKEAKSVYLFPGRYDASKPTNNITKFWQKLLKEANIEKLRIHDLRHTYASHLVSSGVSPSAVGKLLGHTQAATTQRYTHLADQVLRDATNVMGDKITSLKKNGTSSQKS